MSDQVDRDRAKMLRRTRAAIVQDAQNIAERVAERHLSNVLHTISGAWVLECMRRVDVDRPTRGAVQDLRAAMLVWRRQVEDLALGEPGTDPVDVGRLARNAVREAYETDVAEWIAMVTADVAANPGRPGNVRIEDVR